MKRSQTPQDRYESRHIERTTLKFNKTIDADIIARLAAQPKETGGKQGYIKRLIRADIEAKFGRWLDVGGYDTCSVCGFGCDDSFYLGDANYCPQCGAKMDAE